MLSENNHIDDLFRRKESEYIPDTGRTNAHWEKMQQMLNPSSLTPGKKFRISRTRRILRYIGGFTVVTIISVVLITSSKNTKKNFNKTSAPKTAVASQKITPRSTTNTKPDTKQKSTPTEKVQLKNNPVSGLAHSASSTSIKKQTSLKTPVQKTSQGFNVTNRKRSTESIPVSTSSIFAEQQGKLYAVASSQRKDTRELLTEFYDQIRKEEQVFAINALQDTTLKCVEGTLVKIPADAFSDIKGNSQKGEIRIIIREFYEYDDMIKERLSTVSNGKQLVSGGMLHIRAEVDGQEAIVKNGKSLNIEMPTDNYNEQMQLFVGETGSENKRSFISTDIKTDADSLLLLAMGFSSDRGLNWTPVGQQQTFSRQRRAFKMFDAAGDPYKTNYGKKITAHFLVGHDTKMPNKEIKEKLQQRYGLLYDKVKVRRLWWGNKSVNLFTGEQRPVVGDSVEMNFQSALKLKLVSAEDSAKYMSLLKQDSIYNETQSKLRKSYKFTITSLGWYNCDRFLNDPRPRIDFTLNLGEGYEAGNFVSHLIFSRFKSTVMSGSYGGSRIRFDKIPENEPVQLISLGIKDGKVLSCVQKFEAGKNEQGGLHFEETTPQEFAKKLKQLRISAD